MVSLAGCLYIEKTECDRADPVRERERGTEKGETDFLSKYSLPVKDFLSKASTQLSSFLSDYKNI